MSYKIVFQSTARADIFSISEHISKDFLEPVIAEKLVVSIVKHIRSLSEMPKRNKLIADEPFKSKGYRVTYVKNYAVFYKVDDTTNVVTVMRVLYNRREWQNFL